MKKIIITAALLGLSGVAQAISLTLIAHNQRCCAGTLSFLNWRDCGAGPYPARSGCVDPNNAWVIANGVVGATPTSLTWDWDGTTLTSTGTFNTLSNIGSNPAGSVILGDQVVNMVINTGTNTTTADSYNCLEGNYLAGIGANGCLNISTGINHTNESSAVYNVGGNANCVNRFLNSGPTGPPPPLDDESTGSPRGLMTAAAKPGCDAVGGWFDLWTVDRDNLATGGQLILSNGYPLGNFSAQWLTFEVAPVPVPAAAWLIAPAFGLLAPWVKRRRATA